MLATPQNADTRARLAPILFGMGIVLWLGMTGLWIYLAWPAGLEQLASDITSTRTPTPSDERVELTLADPLGWAQPGDEVTLYLPAPTASPAPAPTPSVQPPTPEALVRVRILKVGTPTAGTVPVLVALPSDSNPSQVDRFVSGRPYPAEGPTPSGHE